MAEEAEDPGTRGASRRQALKAGLGVGIGLAAWSGPTITSLGGTPAYAAACTNFTVQAVFNDRNTNQGGGGSSTLTYQREDWPSISTNHVLNLPIPNGGHSNATRLNGTFTFPTGETCRVEVRVYPNGNLTTGPYYVVSVMGPTEGSSVIGSNPPRSSMDVYLPSNQDYINYFNDPNTTNKVADVNANSRYSVRIECVLTPQASCFFG